LPEKTLNRWPTSHKKSYPDEFIIIEEYIIEEHIIMNIRVQHSI